MLQLICRAPYIDQFQAASTQTRSWLYRNFSDFTEEAKIVGKKLFILSEASDSGFGPNIIPGEGFAVTNNFDDQNRLISSNESIYIEWDSYGRPTKTGPTGICTNDQGRSIEYNDSLRTVTENWNSRTLTRLPDGSVPCIAYHTETKYDENGNITSINNISYEIIETKNVCN